MPIQMESAVCDTNRKKGNGVFYPTLIENASPETVCPLQRYGNTSGTRWKSNRFLFLTRQNRKLIPYVLFEM